MLHAMSRFFVAIVQRYLPDAYLFAVILTYIIFLYEALTGKLGNTGCKLGVVSIQIPVSLCYFRRHISREWRFRLLKRIVQVKLLSPCGE